MQNDFWSGKGSKEFYFCWAKSYYRLSFWFIDNSTTGKNDCGTCSRTAFQGLLTYVAPTKQDNSSGLMVGKTGRFSGNSGGWLSKLQDGQIDQMNTLNEIVCPNS